MDNGRIYLVRNGKSEHLVRATHPSRAIAHVVETHMALTAEVASQDDLVRVVSSGGKVEEPSSAS